MYTTYDFTIFNYTDSLIILGPPDCGTPSI